MNAQSTSDASAFSPTIFTRKPKRRVIYLTFRHLVENGIAPDEIAQHFGPRANRSFISVEGEVVREDFQRLASEVRTNQGRRFDKKRFFCDEGELVYANGHTYAFSNQWGDPEWQQVMTNLRNAFPDHRIAFSPSK